ncbi:unnamed protein product [Prorocentrum cordatum]|uniref:Uncharacterized protein n=1 Tax=Prorocentrum cordatum TaxID=2364126 RepID=A0ABN9VE74_9DINO|nr:unnamed protein product [Polarella glacialis]
MELLRDFGQNAPLASSGEQRCRRIAPHRQYIGDACSMWSPTFSTPMAQMHRWHRQCIAGASAMRRPWGAIFRCHSLGPTFGRPQQELEDFVSEMRSRVTAPVLGATLAQRLERHNAMQEQSAGGFLQALDQARARRADTPAWRARRVTLGTRLRQATPSEKREDQLLAARCKGGCKGSRKASGVRSRRLFALQMSDEVIC